MTETPRIWTLLGKGVGDNSQALALAEELRLPFETRTIKYNLLRALGGKLLGASALTAKRQARRFLAPPWPDLVLAVGRRSVPVARYIRKQSGGRSKLVLIGYPRIDPSIFDLVITTPQYSVRLADNVLLQPLAMSRFRIPPATDAAEREWLADLPKPHLLFALGGPTKYWRFPARRALEATQRLSARADALGGSLIVVTSRRTRKPNVAAIGAFLAGHPRHRLVEGRHPRFPVLMADAAEIFVTADSVSMLSEAILFGKPVGIVPIEANSKGRRHLGVGDRPTRETLRRDLRRFWNHLLDEGLAGTIDEPRAAAVENPVVRAARAVRALLD